MSLNDSLINERVEEWSKAVAKWKISAPSKDDLEIIQEKIQSAYEKYLELEAEASPHYPLGLREEIVIDLLHESITVKTKEESMDLLGFDCTIYNTETLTKIIDALHI
jgi:hypothetical protein